MLAVHMHVRVGCINVRTRRSLIVHCVFHSESHLICKPSPERFMCATSSYCILWYVISQVVLLLFSGTCTLPLLLPINISQVVLLLFSGYKYTSTVAKHSTVSQVMSLNFWSLKLFDGPLLSQVFCSEPIWLLKLVDCSLLARKDIFVCSFSG